MTNPNPTELMELAGCCVVCRERIPLTAEQKIVSGVHNWAHSSCHERQMSALRTQGAKG